MEGRLCLQALDRSRNVFRAWRLEAGRDLFGLLTLRVTFGRTGTDGRTVTKIAQDEAHAREMARLMLARRRGATRRAGVAYRLVEQVGLEGWDVPTLLGVQRGARTPAASTVIAPACTPLAASFSRSSKCLRPGAGRSVHFITTPADDSAGDYGPSVTPEGR